MEIYSPRVEIITRYIFSCETGESESWRKRNRRRKSVRRKRHCDTSVENHETGKRRGGRVPRKSINSRTSPRILLSFSHSVENLAQHPFPRWDPGELINPEINGRFPKFVESRWRNGARTTDGKLPSAITRPMTKLPLFNLPTMRPGWTAGEVLKRKVRAIRWAPLRFSIR